MIPIRRLKKVAIVQSDYIPWKGYFDLINLVDEFKSEGIELKYVDYSGYREYSLSSL